ncbi:mariner Mos1 transposase [Trichonephila clavipes]|nr:mariner Mos1 transposase [Trichonephila clavipes]
MAVWTCPKRILKVNLVPRPKHNTAFVGFTRVTSQGKRNNIQGMLRSVRGEERNKWDRKGAVYYKLLKQRRTINANLYCNHLEKLNAAIKEKRPTLASRKGIVFHHDNA